MRIDENYTLYNMASHDRLLCRKKKIEILFDPEMLVSRVESFARGTELVREHKMALPPPVRGMPAREIREIRIRLGLTQIEFAALLNVPKVTAVSWESGTRKPSGAALRLLVVAKHHPEALRAA